MILKRIGRMVSLGEVIVGRRNVKVTIFEALSRNQKKIKFTKEGNKIQLEVPSIML
jgi:hypothetical protein